MLFCPNCNNILDISKNPPKISSEPTGSTNMELNELIGETPNTVSDENTELEPIVKSSSKKEKEKEIKEEIIKEDINEKISTTIQRIVNDQNVSVDDIKDFRYDQIIKSDSFKNLDKKTKAKVQPKISSLFDIKDTASQTAYHICRNCYYHKQIESGTLITSKMNTGSSNNYFNMERLKNLTDSKILPVTRNYLCTNDKCISYKDHTKREAVIYRIGTNLQVWYICKACKSYWKGE